MYNYTYWLEGSPLQLRVEKWKLLGWASGTFLITTLWLLAIEVGALDWSTWRVWALENTRKSKLWSAEHSIIQFCPMYLGYESTALLRSVLWHRLCSVLTYHSFLQSHFSAPNVRCTTSQAPQGALRESSMYIYIYIAIGRTYFSEH
jgi:hypothetical protein